MGLNFCTVLELLHTLAMDANACSSPAWERQRRGRSFPASARLTDGWSLAVLERQTTSTDDTTKREQVGRERSWSYTKSRGVFLGFSFPRPMCSAPPERRKENQLETGVLEANGCVKKVQHDQVNSVKSG